jgi:hypothetical protein
MAACAYESGIRAYIERHQSVPQRACGCSSYPSERAAAVRVTRAAAAFRAARHPLSWHMRWPRTEYDRMSKSPLVRLVAIGHRTLRAGNAPRLHAPAVFQSRPPNMLVRMYAGSSRGHARCSRPAAVLAEGEGRHQCVLTPASARMRADLRRSSHADTPSVQPLPRSGGGRLARAPPARSS